MKYLKSQYLNLNDFLGHNFKANNHVESVHFVKINQIAVVQANSIWRSRQRFQRQWLVELGCQIINHESLRYRHHQEFQVLLETWGFHNRHFSNHRHQSPGNGHEDINHKMEVMEVTWLHFLSPVMNEINTLVLKQKIQALLSKQRLYRKSFERNRKKLDYTLYKKFDIKNII